MSLAHNIDIQTATAAGLNPEALVSLGNRIQADIDNGRNFGASVIVARGGTIGYQNSFGMVAPGRAAKDDDLYMMMSLSKAYNAAIVMRAIDQGRFTLDTRVCDILPYFAVGGKQNVTIRQLLNHTAGTYSGILPPPPLTPMDVGSLEKNVRAVSALPIANIPGERVVYNPFASYAILGQILVDTDPHGRSYQNIAREELFAPLSMTDSSYGLAANEPRRVPVSFTESNTTPMTPMLSQMLNAGFDENAEHPAGGAFSTAADVFKFTEALRGRGTLGDYRLFSPAMFQYASQIHTGTLSNGAWDFEREAKGIAPFPANVALLGGYARGEGHFIHPAGHMASPRTICAVGGGSTFWMVDPERDLTFVFLSAGFIEGLTHMERLQRLSDLALASVD